MQARPAFGKSILLGASLCSLAGGCAMTGPPPLADQLISSGPVSSVPVDGELIASGPTVVRWEDPCSPDWPAACMPGEFAPVPRPLLSCLARWPRHQEPAAEASPYPRYHPLPTRPMFSPAPPAAPLPPLATGISEPVELGTLP